MATPLPHDERRTAGVRSHRSCASDRTNRGERVMEATHTLVLSQSHEPVDIVPWQRAITLLFLGKCEVLEEYERNVKTTSLVIKVPAVVRLLSAFRRHRKPVKFSRVNI